MRSLPSNCCFSEEKHVDFIISFSFCFWFCMHSYPTWNKKMWHFHKYLSINHFWTRPLRSRKTQKHNLHCERNVYEIYLIYSNKLILNIGNATSNTIKDRYQNCTKLNQIILPNPMRHILITLQWRMCKILELD